MSDYNGEVQYADDAEMSRDRRRNVLWGSGIVALVVVPALLCFGGAFSASAESVARSCLDAVISGASAEVCGASGPAKLTGNVVRGYEVKNVVGSVVAVDVTFESRAGTDLHETLRFTVENGKVSSIR